MSFDTFGKDFQRLLLLILFLPLSCYSSLGTPMMWMLNLFVIVLHIPKALLICSVYFLFFRLVISTVLSSSSLVFCLWFAILPLEPIHWIFILAIIFFSSKIFIWSSLFFSFVTGVLLITHWSFFMMTTLKYFSGNSGICVILVLASVDCLHLLSLRFFRFLVCRMIFDCFLGIVGFMLWGSGFQVYFRKPCLTSHCKERERSASVLPAGGGSPRPLPCVDTLE